VLSIKNLREVHAFIDWLKSSHSSELSSLLSYNWPSD
jgi:hypothetical protein